VLDRTSKAAQARAFQTWRCSSTFFSEIPAVVFQPGKPAESGDCTLKDAAMMYFWLIPLILLLIAAMTFFFKEGTRRNPVGPSRLDCAEEDEEGGLRG
jgi:hypothetical protein